MMRTARSAVLARLSNLLFIFLLLLTTLRLLPGCSSGSASTALRAVPDRSLSAPLTLTVLPDTYVGGGQAKSIRSVERWEGGSLLVDIVASGAQNLKGIFFHLDYDPGQFTPLKVESRHAIGPDAECLTLALLGLPGVVEYGELCILPQEARADGTAKGFSGDGVLCTLRLAQRPFGSGGRTLAAAPAAAGSAAVLSLFQQTPLANWSYVSLGDYNQNGEVAVSDLTPIGIHFNEDVPGGNLNSIQSVVDGNGDGKVAVADLTAIGLNFKARVASYNVFSSTSLLDLPAGPTDPNGAGAVKIGTVPFTSASGIAGEERLSFTLNTGAQFNDFVWVRPNDAVDGAGQDGTPSNAVQVLAADQGNNPPTAAVQVDVDTGTIPFTVNFDASASTDPETPAALTFEWDFNGDGDFDLESNTDSTVSTDYVLAGQFTVRVKVSDPDGGSDITTVVITAQAAGNQNPSALLTTNVNSGAAPLTVHIDGSASSDADGNITEFRFDFNGDGVVDRQVFNAADTVFDLTYADQGDFNLSLEVLDDDGGLGNDSQLVNISGGDQWLLNDVVDLGENGSVHDIGIAPFNMADTTKSRLHIAYTNERGQIIHQVSNDDGGTSWAQPVLVTGNGNTIDNHGIAFGVVSSRPAMAFYSEASDTLRYVRAVDAAGNTWNSSHLISGAPLISSPSLRIVDGNPAVAFFSADINDGVGDIFFSRAQSSTGESTWDLPLSANGLIPDNGIPVRVVLGFSGDTPVWVANNSSIQSEVADNKKGSDWDGSAEDILANRALDFAALFESSDSELIAFIDKKNNGATTPSFGQDDNVFQLGTNLFDHAGVISPTTAAGPLIVLNRTTSQAAVVYQDARDSSINFVETTNPNGQVWGPPRSFDFGVDTACFDMTVMNGHVVVVYLDADDHKLRSATYTF